MPQLAGSRCSSVAGTLKLRYRRVLLTGSGTHADELTKLLATRGAVVRHVPVLEIVPARIPSALRTVKIGDCEHVIFMSPNAVRYGLSLLPSLRTHLVNGAQTYAQTYAIGRASARLLREHGIVARVPRTETSESLLCLAELETVEGSQALIVRGVGGRTLVSKTLRQRGAVVHHLPGYRRVIAQDNAPRLQALLRARECDVAVMASTGALKNACHLSGRENRALRALPVCVPSARVAAAARRLGYNRILRARSAQAMDTYDALC